MRSHCFRLTFMMSMIFGGDLTAQDTGRISGTVLGGAGQPLFSANVTLGPDRPLRTTTDRTGAFVFSSLPPGEYVVTLRMIGYAGESRPVRLSSGERVDLTFQLQAAPVTLEDIAVLGQRKQVVSATRSNMELIDIPMAVQIVDRQVIQQQQIINLREVFRNVSGIQNTAAWGNGSRRLDVSARGFLLNDPNFRRNGLLISNEGNHFSDHIEEVQVLKGPASVLYGDVSPGGVVNFVTKKPLGFDVTELRLTTGSWGLVRPSLDLNRKLREDGRIAMRLNATYEKSDHYRDRVNNQYVMVAPSILIKPNDRLSWNIEGFLRDDRSVEDPGIFVPSVTLEEARSVPYNRFYGNPAARNEFTENSLGSTLEYRLPSGLQVRLTSQYQSVPRLNRGIWQNWVYSVGDTVALANFGIDTADPLSHPALRALNVSLVNGNKDIVLHEPVIEYGNSATFDDLKNYANLLEASYSLNAGGMVHNALIGFDHTYSTDRITYERFPNSIGSFNNPDPSIMPNILELNAAASPYQDIQVRRGLNFQDQVMLFGQRLHLLMGVRFNWYKRDRAYDNRSERPADYLNVVDRPVLPRFGMVYKWRPNVSVYASFAESFEVNGRHRYKPEEFLEPTLGRQFEAGAKASFLDEKLGVTLAAFELKKENQPNFILASLADARGLSYDPAEVSIDGHILYISKAQRSRGIELDFSGKISDQLSVNGNYTYLRTSLLDDLVFKSGNELENAPNHSVGLWSNYEFDQLLPGLSLGYGVFHQSDYFGDKDNSEGGLHPANTQMSLAMGYQLDQFKLRLNVENLTDERTYFNSYGYYWLPQPPRRVLLSVGVAF